MLHILCTGFSCSSIHLLARSLIRSFTRLPILPFVRLFRFWFCLFRIALPHSQLALFIDTKIYIWKSNNDLYFLLCVQYETQNVHFICVVRTFYPLVHSSDKRLAQCRNNNNAETPNWNNENSPCRFVIIRHCIRSKWRGERWIRFYLWVYHDTELKKPESVLCASIENGWRNAAMVSRKSIGWT